MVPIYRFYNQYENNYKMYFAYYLWSKSNKKTPKVNEQLMPLFSIPLRTSHIHIRVLSGRIWCIHITLISEIYIYLHL